jgi:uncharacterized membrane protein
MLQNISLDGILGIAFGVSAAFTLGIFSGEAFGVSLGETYSIAGVSITLASIVSVLALLGVWVLNDPSIDSLSTETQVLAVAALGIVGLGAVSPSVLDPVTFGTSAPLALAVWTAESSGYWALATSN